MRAMTGLVTGLWRWRRNPLWRRTDRIEAWLALAAVLLMVLGAPAAGWYAGRAAYGTLLEGVRIQRETRHPVWATVERPASRTPLGPDPETPSSHAGQPRVVASWTARDGSAHTGRIAAPRALRPGERFRIWADGRGLVLPPPMDAGTAATHAALAGLGAAAAAGCLVGGGRRLAVRRLTVRRHRRWDLAWERAGQDWGRAGAGS